MGLVVAYSSPATPGVSSWIEDLSSAVRLGTIQGLVDEAELGAVGISSLLFDDPTATLGHLADGLTGLKQLHIDETACPPGDQRLWTGYIADRHYRRGTDSLITGAARKIDATLTDVNGFLSFRIFAPVTMDATSSFVRSAETDIARVNALLAVDFLSTTLFDDGLVASTGGVAMDACDYTGQHPADVLNDCSQASGRNHWAQYNEATWHYQLWYDFDYSASYSSSLQISNVLADVDDVTTFAPEPDAELVRDPSRVISAVYMPFNGSNSPAYRTRPANASNYAWRDATAPSSNVKTLAKANARADRYLADNSTEDDRITCTVKLPASKVTGIKPGHRVQAKFSHMPNSCNFRWMRVLNRNVMANEQTNQLYNVRYELSPLPGLPQGAFASGVSGSAARPTLLHATTPGHLLVMITTAGQVTYQSTPTNFAFAAPSGGAGPSWTQAVFEGAHDPSQYGGPAPQASFGIYWRRVAVGEVTTTPVDCNSTGAVETPPRVWLWEFDTASDPGAAYGYTTGLGSGSGIASGGTATLPSTSGFTLGGFAMQAVEYEYILAPVAISGTVVQGTDGSNRPYAATRTWQGPGPGSLSDYSGPPIWLATSTGAALSASITYDEGTTTSALTPVGVAGGVIELPGVTIVPNIPYPANQV